MHAPHACEPSAGPRQTDPPQQVAPEPAQLVPESWQQVPGVAVTPVQFPSLQSASARQRPPSPTS